MTTSVKPPIWFWIISVFALLWNLVGVYRYLDQAFNQLEILETLNQAQREVFEAFPAWATACFATAVFSGTIASIALLFRKKWAKLLFIISLVTATAQFICWLFVLKAPEVFPNSYTLPVLVVLFGTFFIFFSKKATEKGWLS